MIAYIVGTFRDISLFLAKCLAWGGRPSTGQDAKPHILGPGKLPVESRFEWKIRYFERASPRGSAFSPTTILIHVDPHAGRPGEAHECFVKA